MNEEMFCDLDDFTLGLKVLNGAVIKAVFGIGELNGEDFQLRDKPPKLLKSPSQLDDSDSTLARFLRGG